MFRSFIQFHSFIRYLPDILLPSFMLTLSYLKTFQKYVCIRHPVFAGTSCNHAKTILRPKKKKKISRKYSLAFNLCCQVNERRLNCMYIALYIMLYNASIMLVTIALVYCYEMERNFSDR